MVALHRRPVRRRGKREALEAEPRLSRASPTSDRPVFRQAKPPLLLACERCYDEDVRLTEFRIRHFKTPLTPQPVSQATQDTQAQCAAI